MTKSFEKNKFRLVNLISNFTPILAIAGIGFALTNCTQAAEPKPGILMIDFGPTTVTGPDQTNSPYHLVDSSFEGTAWNKIEKSDVSESLVYADGSPAKNITVTLGISTSLAPTVISFLRKPSSSVPLGAKLHRGVFAASSAGTDGILSGQTNASNIAVGVKIGGLAPGNYDVYIVGINTNQDPKSVPSESFHAVTVGDESNVDYAALGAATSSTNDTFSSWEEGHNFVKIKASVRRGQSLVIIAHGDGASESRGCLNAIQIVPAS